MIHAAAADPERRLSPVVRLAPAKLNLTLAVLGRRADGFHDLHSVMVPLALADRLTLAIAPGGRDSLHVEGRDAGPIADNLVLQAIAAARVAVRRVSGPDAGPPLAVRLEKRIPVAAGLGGGSSDAAAALEGALEAWGEHLPAAERLTIAAGLGSDVPFFLADRPALVEGRGERVSPLRTLRGEPPAVLLITPAIALSTPAVFAAYAAGARPAVPGSARATSQHLAAELDGGLRGAALLDRAAILAAANDLQPAAAAVAPGLVAFRRALFRRLGQPVGQTGSGPTLWVLYAALDEAEAAADSVLAGLADGSVPRLGSDDAAVIATTIARPGLRPDPTAAGSGATPVQPAQGGEG
ncbi:MAG TPA: hypothetical protein VF763_10125 [Candidatus Limnocylindrales bacterium]